MGGPTVIDAKSFMAGLPTNRKRGYVELGERVSAALESSDRQDREVITLAKLMEAYAGKYKMDFVGKQDNERWYDHLIDLIRGSEFIGHELDAEEAANEALEHLEEYEKSGKPHGYAHLTPDEKKAIHKDLDKIRKTIEASALDDRKKRAIYSRLNKFAAEVDKNGTNTDVFFAFVGELSFAFKGAEEQNRPIIEHIKDMLKIIYNRRAEDEGNALPAPANLPRLPPQSGTPETDIDDDIPF
jgi:hypothetical protein